MVYNNNNNNNNNNKIPYKMHYFVKGIQRHSRRNVKYFPNTRNTQNYVYFLRDDRFVSYSANKSQNVRPGTLITEHLI